MYSFVGDKRMEDIAIIITAIGGLIAIFISLFTAVTAAKKEAFDQLERIVKTLQGENEKLQGRVTTLENELICKNEEIDKRDDMIEDLKDWAERLVSQVKSAGLDPVPFKKRRSA
jgi:predicted PurR-regulated permease PerM